MKRRCRSGNGGWQRQARVRIMVWISLALMACSGFLVAARTFKIGWGLQNMRMWWRYHTVTADETLASIAEQYHTTPRAIAQANNLADGETAQQDNGLVIPIAPGKRGGMAQTYSKRLTVYKIRKGDTVQRVADNFGVPAIMIRRWNHLHGDSLAARHVLYVHLPLSPQVKEAAATVKSHKLTPASHKTGPVVRHKVRPGETLTSIASSNHTTVSAIKRDNGNLATLRPGMVLLLHSVP